MSNTPLTDAELLRILNDDEIDLNDEVDRMADFARTLERELNAAKVALSGRTVSCSNCNELAAENAGMRATIQIIYDAAECCADGAPDASDHDKLCNELTNSLKAFIK